MSNGVDLNIAIAMRDAVGTDHVYNTKNLVIMFIDMENLWRFAGRRPTCSWRSNFQFSEDRSPVASDVAPDTLSFRDEKAYAALEAMNSG